MIGIPSLRYERRLAEARYRVVAGVDEVGRGAWAGPLVAAAVVMPLSPRLYRIRDSKQLSPKKRARLAQKIKNHALAWSVSMIASEEVDTLGIVRANRKALMQALCSLSVDVDHALVDAFTLYGLPMHHTAIPHGDATVYSIAAASIVAKVTRDHMMEEEHERFPHFHFYTNKGYGTAEHLAALQQYGLTPLHRRSFLPMKSMI